MPWRGYLHLGHGLYTEKGVLTCKGIILLKLLVAKCNELLVVLCSNDNAFHVQRIFLPKILKYFKLIKDNLKSVQFSVMLLMQAPVPPIVKPSPFAH